MLPLRGTRCSAAFHLPCPRCLAQQPTSEACTWTRSIRGCDSPGRVSIAGASWGSQRLCPGFGEAEAADVLPTSGALLPSCPGQWAGQIGCMAIGWPLHGFPGRGASEPGAADSSHLCASVSWTLRNFRRSLSRQGPLVFAAAPAQVGILSLQGSKVATE